jgi:hypothetical protein
LPDVFGRQLVAGYDELEADDHAGDSLGRLVRVLWFGVDVIWGRHTRVISLCWPSSFSPQFLLLRKLAATGPKQMPISMAGTCQ